MSRRLHLALELLARDHDAEVRLLRRDAAHGLVVRVEEGVVVDFEVGGVEGGCYLEGG